MTNHTPDGMLPPCQPKKRHLARTVILAITGLVVVIVALSAALGGGKTPAGNAGASPPATSTTAALPAAAPAQTTPAPVPAQQYTAAQQQAIDAAEGYLTDGQGFSKAGLISQLHSPDGNGFSLSLAKFAVSHVQVGWKHQAVIAAKGYMSDGEGFSYEGLVQQLDSQYGGQFTLAQAEYAAKAVGL
jgi:hypothetical protein